MSTLERIRRKILDGNYRFSRHMERESMRDHGLLIEDIENAILRGRIIAKIRDPFGTQYAVEGPALDDRMVVTIVRFAVDNNLFFITVYES